MYPKFKNDNIGYIFVMGYLDVTLPIYDNNNKYIYIYIYCYRNNVWLAQLSTFSRSILSFAQVPSTP